MLTSTTWSAMVKSICTVGSQWAHLACHLCVECTHLELLYVTNWGACLFPPLPFVSIRPRKEVFWSQQLEGFILKEVESVATPTCACLIPKWTWARKHLWEPEFTTKQFMKSASYTHSVAYNKHSVWASVGQSTALRTGKWELDTYFAGKGADAQKANQLVQSSTIRNIPKLFP